MPQSARMLYAQRVLNSPSAFFLHFTGRAPFDYQVNFLHDESPRVAWASGRQIGKTECLAVKALYHALTGPDRTVLFLSFNQAKAGLIFWRARQIIEHSAFLKRYILTETAAKLRFKNGSSIVALPAGMSEKSPSAQDAGRGYAATLVIVDEASRVPDAAFASFEPTLATTHGQLILTSTPYGARGRFWQACKGSDSPFFTHHFTPSPLCPNITKEFLKQQEALLTEVEYRQEWLGEFIASTDLFFPHELWLHCISQPPASKEELTECDYFLGVDLAEYGVDSSVYIITAINPVTLDCYLLHVESTSKVALTDAMGRIKKLHSEWNFRRIYVDSTGLGAGVAAEVMEAGLPLTPIDFGKDFNKEKLFLNLKKTAEDGRLHLPDHDRLRAETTQLIYSYSSNGHLKVAAPEVANAHDDYPVSLALSIWAARHKPIGFGLAGTGRREG